MPARRRGEARRTVNPFFRVSGFNSFCRHQARVGLNGAKRVVAQLGSASALGAEGRAFNSRQPDIQFRPRSSEDQSVSFRRGRSRVQFSAWVLRLYSSVWSQSHRLLLGGSQVRILLEAPGVQSVNWNMRP